MKFKYGSFLLGTVFGALLFSSSLVLSESRYDKLRLYAQVFNLIEENYVEKVNVDQLVVHSIRGLLGKLDPYSGYLSPKFFRKFKSESEGGFSGFGLELALKKRKLTVVSVVEDSPAWVQGIQPRDQIYKINSKVVDALDFTAATKSFSGPVGKRLKLTIRRPGADQDIKIQIRKRRMNIRPVSKVQNQNSILTVRIKSFSKGAARDLKKILKKEKYNKLVIDLRNNPGGLLDEAIKVVDLFVDRGLIVKTKKRGKDLESSFAQESTTLDSIHKVFVLVDSSSASASEILASALRDLRKSKIFGIKSYGKGSVQSVIPLPKKQGGVKMTVARYFTASDKMIDKKGIKPDFVWKAEGRSTMPVKNLKEDHLLQWALGKVKGL